MENVKNTTSVKCEENGILRVTRTGEFVPTTKDKYNLYNVVEIKVSHDDKTYTLYAMCTSINETPRNGDIFNSIEMKKNVHGATMSRRRTHSDFKYVYKNNEIIATEVVVVELEKSVLFDGCIRGELDIVVLTYLFPEDSTDLLPIFGDILKDTNINNKVVNLFIEPDYLISDACPDPISVDSVLANVVDYTYFPTIEIPINEYEDYFISDYGSIVYLNGEVKDITKKFSVDIIPSLLSIDSKFRNLIDWNTLKELNSIEFDKNRNDRRNSGKIISNAFTDVNELLTFLEAGLETITRSDDINAFNDLDDSYFKSSILIHYLDKNKNEKYMLFKNYRNVWNVLDRIRVLLSTDMYSSTLIKNRESFEQIVADKNATLIQAMDITVEDEDGNEIRIDVSTKGLKIKEICDVIFEQKFNINQKPKIKALVNISTDGIVKEYFGYNIPVAYSSEHERWVLAISNTTKVWR